MSSSKQLRYANERHRDQPIGLGIELLHGEGLVDGLGEGNRCHCYSIRTCRAFGQTWLGVVNVFMSEGRHDAPNRIGV